MTTESVASTVKERWNWPWMLLGLLIALVACYLRLEGLGEPSFWYDEILHMEKTEATLREPWHAWLTGLSVDDENGPLYYATQLIALRVLPNETGARLMPALAGIVTVGVLFAVGLAATGDRRTGLVCAALLAISPLHVYYSREARPYAAVMLMASLLLLLLLARRRPWTLAAVYLTCIATAYLGAVAAPVLLSFALISLASFIWGDRSTWSVHFSLAAALGLGIGVLLFPFFERITTAPETGEMIVTHPISLVAADRLLGSLTVSGVEWAAATPRSYLFLALALAGAIILAAHRRWPALAIAGMFVLPITSWLVLLVILHRWYNIRYTSAGLPALLLLVAIGMVGLVDRLTQALTGDRAVGRLRWLPTMVLLLMTVGLVGPGWRAARTEPGEKPDWRGLVAILGALALEDEPIVTQGWWAERCIQHYSDRASLDFQVHDSHGDPDQARELVADEQSAWLVAGGYESGDAFRRWMHGFDPIMRSPLAHLELYYHPDFATFLSSPNRVTGLSVVLEKKEEPGHQRNFGVSEILLGSGWSYPETARDGTSFRWAMAPVAEVGLSRTSAEETLLRLRVLPFPNADLPPQTIEVLVNTILVDRLELVPGWSVYEILVPGALWEAGPNLVSFQFGWQQSPVDLNPNSTDPRELAAAFDFVEVIRNHPNGSRDAAN